MNSSIKRARIILAAAVSACAMLALSAGSASAAELPAWWTNPGSGSVSGSLTLKVNGANEKTCTVSSGSAVAANQEAGGIKLGTLTLINNFGPNLLEFSCTGSTKLQVEYAAATVYEASNWVSTQASSAEFLQSPYGTWHQAAWKRPWTNGIEGKQSTFSFSNTSIGTAAAGTVTATGTITVTRTGGGAFTLTH